MAVKTKKNPVGNGKTKKDNTKTVSLEEFAKLAEKSKQGGKNILDLSDEEIVDMETEEDLEIDEETLEELDGMLTEVDEDIEEEEEVEVPKPKKSKTKVESVPEEKTEETFTTENYKEVPIKSIKISKERRIVNEEKVKELAESIDTIGLISPIVIDMKNNLVTGHHRLRAYQLLGKTMIPCLIQEELNDLKYKLREIDENLIRHELHFIERGEQLKRRKEIYETLYPETKKGQFGSGKGKKEDGKKSFIDDSSKKLGKSRSYVSELLRINDNVEPSLKKLILTTDISRDETLLVAKEGKEVQGKIKDEVEKLVKEGKSITGKTVKEILRDIKKEEKREEFKSFGELTTQDFKVRCADSTKINFPPDTYDCLISDPPYNLDATHLFHTLGEHASRTLKPGKFLVVYTGQLYANKVMSILDSFENLQFYWMIALKHGGHPMNFQARNMICNWKPILIYQKKPFKKLETAMHDFIQGGGREKDHHDWQQGADELTTIIENFTKPGDVILDCFAGGGTTGIMSYKLKRKSVLIDIDSENVSIIKGRFNKEFGTSQSVEPVSEKTEKGKKKK